MVLRAHRQCCNAGVLVVCLYLDWESRAHQSYWGDVGVRPDTVLQLATVPVSCCTPSSCMDRG